MKSFWLWFAVVVLLSFGLIGPSPIQPVHNPIEKSVVPSPEVRPPLPQVRLPAPTATVPTPQAGAAPATDLATFGLTAVQAVAAAVGSVVAVLLYRVTRGQLDVAASQARSMEMQTSILAAGHDIALAQKEIARFVALNSSRPVFLLARVELIDHEHFMFAPPFSYYYVNHGNTPANVKGVYGTFAILEELTPAFVETLPFSDRYYVVTPGKQTEESRIEVSDIPDDDFLAIRNGSKSMFALVAIQYEGMSGSKHETRSCWRLMIRNGVDIGRFVEFGGEEFNKRT